MYENTFDLILSQVLEKKGLETPASLGDLWTLMSELNNGRFGDPIRGAFKGPKEFFFPYEAMGFAIIWSKILAGNVAYSVLPLSDQCGLDVGTAHNNRILRSGRFVCPSSQSRKPLRFSAEFRGGLGDNDGHFETLSSLAATRHVQGQDACAFQTVLLKPHWYPLEVGSSAVGTTVMHILAEGGLARWPYGTTSLYIFHLLREGDENDPPKVIASQPCDRAGAPVTVYGGRQKA